MASSLTVTYDFNSITKDKNDGIRGIDAFHWFEQTIGANT